MNISDATRHLPSLRREIRAFLEPIPVDFGGGCSVQKAVLLALLALHGSRPSIDVGVYRGRSLLPQALAQRLLGGYVIGIDPFSRHEAHQFDNVSMAPQLNAFVDLLDPQDILRDLQARIQGLGFDQWVRLVQEPSQRALRDLPSGAFGLVHVDGNHDAAKVSADLRLAIPLLAEGGWLVVDDVSWPSVAKGLAVLEDHLVPCGTWSDATNDHAIYCKTSPDELGPRGRKRTSRDYFAWADAEARSTL